MIEVQSNLCNEIKRLLNLERCIRAAMMFAHVCDPNKPMPVALLCVRHNISCYSKAKKMPITLTSRGRLYLRHLAKKKQQQNILSRGQFYRVLVSGIQVEDFKYSLCLLPDKMPVHGPAHTLTQIVTSG